MATLKTDLIKKLTAEKLAKKTTPAPTATATPVSASPKTDLIKSLTIKNLQSKDTLSTGQQSQLTRLGGTVPTATPTTTTPATTGTNLNVDYTAPESAMQAGAEQTRTATDALLAFLNTKPTESSLEEFKRLQTEAGRPELITSRNETFKTVQRVNSQIKDLRENIIARTKDVGITEAQASRREALERQPLTRELEALNDTLALQNLQVADVDNQIQNLMDLGRQDKADELTRLVNLANYSGLTQDEKDVLSFQIDKKMKEDAKVEATAKEKEDTLNSGIETLRQMATSAGILTGAFAGVVQEAQRRLEAGEDPQTILADVSAAVLKNPTLQRQFEIERIKAEQSILPKSSGSGGGGGSGSLSSKELNEITSLVELTNLNDPNQADYIEEAYTNLSTAGKIKYLEIIGGGGEEDTSGGDAVSTTKNDINNAQSTDDINGVLDNIAEAVKIKLLDLNTAKQLSEQANAKKEILKKSEKETAKEYTEIKAAQGSLYNQWKQDMSKYYVDNPKKAWEATQNSLAKLLEKQYNKK